MPIRDYPFIEIGAGGAVSVRTQHSRPRLWIRVVNPITNLAVDTAAIVDTGADDCLFPAEWAIKLGYDLESSSPLEIHTANRATYAYMHPTYVAVLGALPNGQADKNRVLHALGTIQVRYTKGLGQFLLGQAAFLSKFIMVINYPEKKFSLRSPQSYIHNMPRAKRARHGVH